MIRELFWIFSALYYGLLVVIIGMLLGAWVYLLLVAIPFLAAYVKHRNSREHFDDRLTSARIDQARDFLVGRWKKHKKD